MNTTKNTKKRSRKTTKPVCTITLPPVVEMVPDKVDAKGFVEDRSLRYTLKYVALCLLVGFFGYWSVQKYKQFALEKLSNIPTLLNAPQQKTQLVDIKADNVRDALDTAE